MRGFGYGLGSKRHVDTFYIHIYYTKETKYIQLFSNVIFIETIILFYLWVVFDVIGCIRRQYINIQIINKNTNNNKIVM